MPGEVSRATAEGGRPSLDQRTQLPPGGCWGVSIWQDAGEAVISYRRPIGDKSDETAWSQLSEDEQRARNHARATQRARSASRRYMVANRLRFMWVLTFGGKGLHGPDGRRRCMLAVAEFAERLRRVYGEQPYWYSPELHPDGHGWHVNVFVQRRLAHAQVRDLWGRGHVWVKDWTRDSRVQQMGLSVVDAIRLGADYGCKYASKDWSEEALEGGAHRYEVAQRYQPRRRTVIVPTLATAFAEVRWVFRRDADSVWSYEEAEHWDGPPVWCLRWRLDNRLTTPERT